MAPGTTPRHVLIIVQNLPVPFDRRVWQEATELAKAGYEVSVICPKGRGFDAAYEQLNGIHIYRHPLPFEAHGATGYLLEYASSLFWEFYLACKIAWKRGFDAIHACNPPDNIFLIGGFFKYLFCTKFLFDHHDINPELYEAKFGRRDFFYRVMLWWERLTFRVADVSIATNESYRRIAIERGKMPPEKVFVVRSGPSLERMKIMPPVEARRMGKQFLVGYVGVMGQQEGIQYLLEAARIIVQEWRREDVHFTLVGGGPALAEMQQLAHDKQIDAYVTFTGRAPDDVLLEVLNTADICVNPDEANVMNDLSTMNKIMEYMALSKPIVQFDLREGKFSAGEASLYAKPNDARDFAEKIVALLDDPARREAMGAFGRARVENELAWPHEAPKLLAAYDALFAPKYDANAIDVVMLGPYPADHSLIKGGVQASVYGLSRALKSQPGIHSVSGISLPLNAQAQSGVTATMLDDIPVTYLNAPYRFLASSIVHVRRTLRQISALKNPVVHVHGTGLFQFGMLAALRLKSVPTVWTLHGITQKEMWQKFRAEISIGNIARAVFYGVLERLSLLIAPRVIVDTDYVRDALQLRAKISVVPQGIFYEEFATMDGTQRNQSLILSLGVIEPRKGHHLLLEAFALLRNSTPDAQLVVAGSLTSVEYHQQLLQQIAKLNLNDCVSLRTNLPRSEILQLLAQARLFALHSQEESQGIAICEALAAGLPVVATNVGGIPYVVTDGEDGLLTDYGHIPAFANAMGRLLKDTALYASIATRAKHNAQRFDWKIVAENVAAIYRAALGA